MSKKPGNPLKPVRSAAAPPGEHPNSAIDAVTIAEVAKRAGVSAGTVSRVLNGKNKENRPAIAKRSQQIRDIALELGYRPNTAARQMVHGRFGLVGLVSCGDLGRDFLPRLLVHGIHLGLEESATRLLFNELSADRMTDVTYVPRLFRESTVDGLIVHLEPNMGPDITSVFLAQPVPCVFVNNKLPMNSVYPDDLQGAAKAVHHCVSLGHKYIGFFHRPQTGHGHYSCLDRKAGFIAAMEEVGRDPSFHPDFTPDQGYIHCRVFDAEAFLDRFPSVTAVICYEMEEALAMREACIKRGRMPPDALYILAFGEREIRALTGVNVPTLMVPFKAVGEEAALMVASLIGDRTRRTPSVAVPFGDIVY